jgi:hypothetical protein
MRGTYWLMTLAMATTVATATGATEERSPLATCGHYEELAAAKRALQEGDKASALIHLRNADALLTQCKRDSERAAEPADAEPADETVVGGTEAPPTPSV